MTPFLKISTRSSGLMSSPKAPVNAKSVAAMLIAGLREAGVEVCFGIPGRHVQLMFHGMPAAGIRAVLARHEQGAVYMADGYARASGQPAMVAATAGPGAANMVTGVANAYADGVPVVCLTGAPARHFGCRGTFQELGDDHTGVTPAIFAPITRYNAQLSHPSQLEPAVRLALNGLNAGPVNLTIPADVLDAPSKAVRPSSRVLAATVPDAGAVAEAARLLTEFPDALILAGRGAIGAREALTALAEKLQIPVVTTVHGRGAIDEEHPLALGPQGFSASHWAERYLGDRRPAVVLAVGTSMREISTNVYSDVFAGTEALIHCTKDATMIGRHYPATVAVASDAEAFLKAVAAAVEPRVPNADLAAFKATTPRFDDAGLADGPGRISPRRVVESVRQALRETDMLFVDTGNAIPWTLRYFPVRQPGTYFASVHLAAMGWGVAASVGAQLARPTDRVVAIVGDGCFQMAGMEVATAVQYGLPVVWVVLNDARLNMVYQGTEGYYGEAVVNTTLSPIDCARIAEGLGAVGFRVDDPADLDAAIAQALACGRPAVVDVAIDPELRPSMAGRFEAIRCFEGRQP
ncbi:putative acetolactate synthase large subunit IlvB2 [compost metagenome]